MHTTHSFTGVSFLGKELELSGEVGVAWDSVEDEAGGNTRQALRRENAALRAELSRLSDASRARVLLEAELERLREVEAERDAMAADMERLMELLRQPAPRETALDALAAECAQLRRQVEHLQSSVRSLQER